MSVNKKSKKMSLLGVGYEMANGLYDAGIIDATTMREFDVLSLPPVKKFSPRQIKQLRLCEKVSQIVFAKILNTTASTISQWEQGDKQPSGISLKLLNLVAQKGLQGLL